MSSQSVKSKLPLWGAAILLPVLLLGFYLESQRQSSPAPKETQSFRPEPLATVNKPRDELPRMAQPESNPAQAVIAETPAPAQLLVQPDIETARQAVFRKETAVYEKATALFEAEAIDVEWAGGYEQSLREMFSSHPGLMRVSVNTINCHTSMCRVEVFTPRDTDADYFTAMFYNALDNFREGSLKAEAAIARRMEVGMTSVYIARQGHELGFY